MQLVHGNYQILSTVKQDKHEIDDNKTHEYRWYFLETVCCMGEKNQTKPKQNKKINKEKTRKKRATKPKHKIGRAHV